LLLLGAIALLFACALAEGALVSMTHAHITAFVAVGNTAYTAGSTGIAQVAHPAGEARAALDLKIRIQPWGSMEGAKIAASVTGGRTTGLHWSFRAGTTGRAQDRPMREPSHDDCA